MTAAALRAIADWLPELLLAAGVAVLAWGAGEAYHPASKLVVGAALLLLGWRLGVTQVGDETPDGSDKR